MRLSIASSQRQLVTIVHLRMRHGFTWIGDSAAQVDVATAIH